MCKILWNKDEAKPDIKSKLKTGIGLNNWKYWWETPKKQEEKY